MPDLSWLTARPVAHRGLHDRDAGRIENSMSAFKAAIERTFAIEVDIQIAEDGVAMVFHDSALDRLTEETGLVRSRPGAGLNKIKLSGSNDIIPTFDDLLDEVAGRVPLVIELKPHGPLTDRLAKTIADRLKRYDGRAVVMSFDPEMIMAVARHNPDQLRGITADATPASAYWEGYTAAQRFSLRHLLHIPRTRPHFIAYDCKALPAPGPFLWRRIFGCPVLTWTVRDKAEQNRVRKWTDQIIFEGFDPE